MILVEELIQALRVTNTIHPNYAGQVINIPLIPKYIAYYIGPHSKPIDLKLSQIEVEAVELRDEGHNRLEWSYKGGLLK